MPNRNPSECRLSRSYTKPHDALHGKRKKPEQFTALEPVGRMGQPEEIANAVVWMCSEKPLCNWTWLAVDGGFVAR
jgi:NAD(P)-dependent dehydrogenase (short-subunit alcohol dehydrogenase family)